MAIEGRGVPRAQTIYDDSHPFQRRIEELTDLTLRDALGQPIPPRYTPEQMKPDRLGWVHGDNWTINDVINQQFGDMNLNTPPPTDFNGTNGGYEGTSRPKVTSFW